MAETESPVKQSEKRSGGRGGMGGLVINMPGWAAEATGITTEPSEDVDPAIEEVLSKHPRTGQVENSLQNLVSILEGDQRWSKQILFDSFACRVTLHGVPLTDAAETEVSLWLSRIYGIQFVTPRVHEALVCIAKRHPIHPVQEYLDSLVWDGVRRLETWLQKGLGSKDVPILRRIGRAWMISCVARIMEPGCQVDTTLILVGPQGSGKSSAFRALMPTPDWFSDTPLDLRSKDAFASLSGVWAYELAELDSVKRSEHSAVKAFLSSRVDKYRPVYGRNVEQFARQCVIVGSTNDDEFLTDPTGSRRFWPIPTDRIDLDWIRENRDQLWAEAEVAFRAGEHWWLDHEGEKEVAEMSAQYKPVDPWEPVLQEWLRNRVRCTTTEALSEAIKIDTGRQGRRDEMRVAVLLRAAGWTRERIRVDGLKRWVWLAPGAHVEPEVGTPHEVGTENK